MRYEQIAKIELNASDVFVNLGFKPGFINSEKVYEYNGAYHKFTFVSDLGGFVIEGASSYDDACKNLYDDCDVLPITSDEEEILNELHNLLAKHYMS